jgi:hypothetical protein
MRRQRQRLNLVTQCSYGGHLDRDGADFDPAITHRVNGRARSGNLGPLDRVIYAAYNILPAKENFLLLAGGQNKRKIDFKLLSLGLRNVEFNPIPERPYCGGLVERGNNQNPIAAYRFNNRACRSNLGTLRLVGYSIDNIGWGCLLPGRGLRSY